MFSVCIDRCVGPGFGCVIAVVSSKVGDAAVLELTTKGVITWPHGHDSDHASWIVCITNGHVGRRSGGSTSRVNISSVDGDIYDRDVLLERLLEQLVELGSEAARHRWRWRHELEFSAPSLCMSRLSASVGA